MKAYQDKNNPGNGTKYHTGEPCATEGCTQPAGTAWSPYWCVQHNIERIDRITASLERIANRPNEWPYKGDSK